MNPLDNDTMEDMTPSGNAAPPSPTDQLAEMLMAQMQQINQQLQASLAAQAARHEGQLAELRRHFETRFTTNVATAVPNPGDATESSQSAVPSSSSLTPDTTNSLLRPHLSERLPDPPLFSGKKKDLAFFLTKLRMKLRGNADRFPDEASRLIYAHSRLDSDPATLINPLMDSHITTVDHLIAFLESTYGDPNKELTAWSRLDNLKQGKKSFLSHFANFRQIIADANLNEAAQISQLRRSLSDNIREKMAGVEIPNSLEAYANLIQRYDNDLRYLPSTRTGNTNRAPRYPVEMELDASGTSKYAPKNSAERQKRIKEGRCFKCGEKGHISPVCPHPNSDQQVRTSATRHHDSSDSDSDSEHEAPTRPSRSRSRAPRSRSSPAGKVSSRG